VVLVGNKVAHLNLRQAEVVKALIEADADVNLATPEENWAPVHDAGRSGEVKVLRLLKDAGAEMMVQTVNGSTALHWAAQYDRMDAVKFLIALDGVDINITNNVGHTAVHVAARYGKLDVRTRPDPAGAPHEHRVARADGGSRAGAQVVKVLVEAGASVLSKDKIERAARDLAVEFKFQPIAAYLDEQAVAQRASKVPPRRRPARALRAPAPEARGGRRPTCTNPGE
jgi:ankyrin repeat protein